MLKIVQPTELKAPFANGAGIFLRPVQDDNLADLQTILDNHQNTDPYQSSAAYYAMTGRDGLWLAKDGDAAVVVCRHPNVRDEFLVFPSIGKDGQYLLAKTMEAVSKTGVKVSLARADEVVAGSLLKKHSNIRLKRVPEQILDWAYPVHVLDTGKVTNCTGRKFQQFRTQLNKIDMKHIQAFDLDPVFHRQAISDLILKWSEGEEEKITPYMRMLDLFNNLPMAGRIVLYQGKPAGFSVWEETSPKSGMANAYAHLGLHEIAGMARYVMLDMCRALHKRGFAKVCVGGSETTGLDQFKRQLRPIESIPIGFSWQFVPAAPEVKKPTPTFAQQYRA